MNCYEIGALSAFTIFAMGVIAFVLGRTNYIENDRSQASKEMYMVCISVFFWDFGYAWMSLCYDNDFAYVARAIALMAINWYMIFALRYVSLLTNFSFKILNTFLGVFATLSILAWTQIIQKDAVHFVTTPWGYWYYSKMSAARILQFITVISVIILYYVILHLGKKKAHKKREKDVLIRFRWFGWIIVLGYMFDTIVPTILHTAAIPGSCICAFFSAMILFQISRKNRTFGISPVNVSQYVFQDVQIPVVITDDKEKIVLYNQYVQQFCEEKGIEYLNHELGDFFDLGEANSKSDGTLALSKITGMSFMMNSTQVMDQFDDLLCTIYFFRDITKEREYMKMLEESRQLAESANAAKSNFLANMSHEIRTPMNAIIGMSDIALQDEDLPEQNRLQLTEIGVAAHNLLDIINDILDISKIEAGKYELVEDTYELARLLNDVSNIITIRVQEANSRYELQLDPTIPKKVIGDVTKVRQILLNILGNAAKFTTKGVVKLSVGWDQNQKEAQLVFDVEDTGIGIKEEDIDKIFGTFTQVDTKKNRSIQGTGLGLAISRNLAQMMHGDIVVSSVYGEGSKFRITIVQQVVEYEELGVEIATVLEKREYQIQETKKNIDIVPRPEARILIVDDSRVNLMVASGLMKKYNMQIDTASSGMEAVEKVKNADYDIVFMDHMMPEMDGIDTTKMIRALGGKFETLTIIALTANAVGEVKNLFLEEGLQDFLSKPIDRKALDEIINKWLPVC